MREFSNLTGRERWRSTLWLGPVVLFVLSLAGVAARPALTLRGAELERAAACARLERLRGAGMDRLPLGRDGVERLQCALERTQEFFPGEWNPIELNERLRMLAKRSGFGLESLAISDPRVVELPVSGAGAVLREATLVGSGGQNALVGLLAALRAGGIPMAVLEAHLVQERDPRAEFQATLRFALFEGVEPRVEEDTSFEGEGP